MARNRIKIVSQNDPTLLRFFFMGENGKWCPAPNSSILSRKIFADSKIKDKSREIVSTINAIYNVGKRGIDIFFEGSEDDFLLLQEEVNQYFPKENINCILKSKIIGIVVGKADSGKTTLIEELANFTGDNITATEEKGITTYNSNSTSSQWYELPGLEVGAANFNQIKNSFAALVETKNTTLIYCCRSNKIESAEVGFIRFVSEAYPHVKTILVLTQYVEEDGNEVSKLMSNVLGGIKVIPVLARNIKTRNGTIEPYGLDLLYQAVFMEDYHG